MLELIKSLAAMPIPSILVIAGIFFLFLAVGGQFGAKIVTDRIKPRSAGIIGAVLLIAGVAIWLGKLQQPSDHRDLQPQIQRMEQELMQNERQQEELRNEIKHLRSQLQIDPNAHRILPEKEMRLQELQQQHRVLQEELERLRRSLK
jgi:septal ring factor EnvC (AmiA/AmiB activator)